MFVISTQAISLKLTTVSPRSCLDLFLNDINVSWFFDPYLISSFCTLLCLDIVFLLQTYPEPSPLLSLIH